MDKIAYYEAALRLERLAVRMNRATTNVIAL